MLSFHITWEFTGESCIWHWPFSLLCLGVIISLSLLYTHLFQYWIWFFFLWIPIYVCPINWPFHSSCYLADQWKFAFLSLGRPEYLADTDTVFNRFQVCFLSINFFFFSLGLVPSRMWVHYICFYFNIFCKLKLCFVSFFQLFFSIFLKRRDVYGAWEQYLGLEHSDNAPKRAYSVNQVIYFYAHYCYAS